MGVGHVMRCLALAQGWQTSGGTVTFLSAEMPGPVADRLHDEGIDIISVPRPHPYVVDLETVRRIIKPSLPTWLVLDGYHFDTEYQRQLKALNSHLLAVDDLAHLDYYHADIILNQNLDADSLAYRCSPETRLFLGPDYALLRREFWNWRAWSRPSVTAARRLLVTLGGSDPDNVTSTVVSALKKSGLDVKARVVVGAGNPHFQELQSVAASPGLTVELACNVTNMPDLMAQADLAIAAAGSTTWELCLMGLPQILITLADNQLIVANGLAGRGPAISLGRPSPELSERLIGTLKDLLSNTDKRQIMSASGRKLVDGLGVHRVIQAMNDSLSH